MKPISAKLVEQTWKRQAQLTPSKIQTVVRDFSESQPMILAYLMAMSDSLLNESESELLLYLGTTVWQMMEAGAHNIELVTETTLEEIEDKNMKMLEYLEGESEDDFIQTVEKIIEGYNQKEVLRYVVEALFESDEDDGQGEIRDEMIGQIFIFLKVIIDCLDQ
ncbi:hypothetical protein JXJ21_20160 [candidate division KSB1 bacterium]|nr:hypothetical protein [candidate division KSB1 bacterium]